MVKIEIKEKGTRAAIKRMVSKSRYLRSGMRRRMAELGQNVGVETVRRAITATGIKSRTGGLLRSVDVLDVSPTSVTIGMSDKEHEEIGDKLDSGGYIPGIPFRVGVTIPLEKGAGEGLVFRRSVGPHRIKAYGWSRRAVDELQGTLPGRMDALLQTDIGEGVGGA